MFGHFFEEELLAVDKDMAVEGLKYFLVSCFVFGVTLIRSGDVLDPFNHYHDQNGNFFIFEFHIAVSLVSVGLRYQQVEHIVNAEYPNGVNFFGGIEESSQNCSNAFLIR